MSNEIKSWYRFAIQQSFAESHLDGIDWANAELVAQRLEDGNTRPGFPPSGYTRLPRELGDPSANTYTIIAHHANDATGFSGTLLRWTNEQGGTEYTLSIRSTEYKNFNQGGDAERDNLLGANGEVIKRGFALGQLAALEDFYEREVLPLTGAAQINVTGYSLGGHLATVFTETHADRVKAAYVFNSAGRGEIVGPGGTTAERMSVMIGQFRAVLISEPNADVLNGLLPTTRAAFLPYYQSALQAHLANPGWNPFAPTDASVYADPRYRWAQIVTSTLGSFATRSVIPFRAGLGTAGDALITSIYGSALNTDTTLVANSQIHPSNKNAVFIEGQPFLERASSSEERSDFGNTHAITLIVDSLALQREFQRLDPTLTREQIEALIKASSAKKAKSVAPLGDSEAAEGDSLEKALLALRRAFDATAVEVQSSATPGGFGNMENRQSYFEQLAALPQQGTYRIEVLAGRPSGQVAVLAKRDDDTGLAVRYALRQLEPFAVVGADYSSARFPGGELELRSASSARGMSDKWIEARAKFLEALARYNAANGDLSPRAIGGYFEDRQRDLRFGPTGAGFPQYIFGADSAGLPLIGAGAGDFLIGGAADDTVTAVGGNDYVEGGGGVDVINAGSGEDEVRGDAGNDELYGGDGNDRLYGGLDNDRLEGGKGNDRLEGGAGFDNYVYSAGDGHDTILDSDGSGQIVYKGRVLAGGQQVDKYSYEDAAGTRYTLVGAPGTAQTLLIDDSLYVSGFASGTLGIILEPHEEPVAPPANAASRFYVNSELPTDAVSNPVVNENTQAVNLAGSDANDFVVTANISFYTRSGDDTITAGPASTFVMLDAGGGNDLIEASDAGNTIERRIAGGAGDDYIVGSAFGDTICGDNYLATVNSGFPQSASIDGFSFNLASLAPGFSQPQPAGGTEFLAESGAFLPFRNLLTVSISQGDVDMQVAIDHILAEGWHFPGGLPAVLNYVLGSSPSFDDYIDAGDGADIIDGGSGSDVIYGGDGDDVIGGDYDAGGFNRITYSSLTAQFGSLASLFGQPGDDYLDGGNGNDRIGDQNSGNDILIGGPGDDGIGSSETFGFDTGAGYNYIDAGPGNDRISAFGLDVVFAGDGDDQIFAFFGASFIDGGIGDDTYVVSGGVIHDASGDDTLTTRWDFLLGTDLSSFESAVLQDSPQPSKTVLEVARNGNDIVLEDFIDPPIPGESPGSTLVIADWFAGPANQIEHPGSLSAAQFEAWGSLQRGSVAGESFFGGSYTDRILAAAGDDLVVSGDGDDWIAGGKGDDVLDGGTGDDKYFYVVGHGNDIMYDESGFDELHFDAGMDLSNVSVELGASSTFLHVAGNTLELIRFGTATAGDLPVDRLVFANGTSLAMVDLISTAVAASGTAGDDTLVGNGAANTIQGGAGDDQLFGGGGNDTYLFALGDGVDRISDSPSTGEVNTVEFGHGIAPDMLTLGRGSLLIRVGSNGDAIHLANVDTNDIFGAHDVELFKFSDGAQLTYDQLIARGLDVVGTSVSDVIVGSNTTDRVFGNAGDDLLLDGAGDDIYFFGRGDGADTIVELDATPENIDMLSLAADILTSDVSIARSGDDIVIRIGNTQDSITIQGALLYDVVERVQFGDGTVWSAETLRERAAPPPNQSPMTKDDTAAVEEDITLFAGGSVIVNDTDPDLGDTLSVANPGTYLGAYGTLELAADGSYSYALDNALAQSLAEGQEFHEVFSYDATDGIASTPGSLEVMVNGTNDAPVLVTPIADQSAQAATAFSFTFVPDVFNDIDLGDTLAYSANLADGAALPSWLSFDAVTRSFSGAPPGGTGGGGGGTEDCGCGTDGGTAPETLQLRVTATDTAGASANDVFVLNIAGGSSGGGIVPIVGTGQDDVIPGTSGSDVIDGRKGYDQMSGGAGDDVYFVDQTCAKDGRHGNEGVGNGEDPPPPGHATNQNDGPGTSPGNPGSKGGGHGDDDDDNDDDPGGGKCRVDLVIEGAVAGYDTVYSSASYTLPANVEELHLIGREDLEGRGNALANMLVGNPGDNRLYGMAGDDFLLDDAGRDLLDGGDGDDVLDGGAGNDRLIGGKGNDLFVHTKGGGHDLVRDSGGQDAILFGAGIAAGDVTVRRTGNDLLLQLSGGNGSVTAKDWFSSASKRVEQVEFADGTVWNESATRSRVTSGSGSGQDGCISEAGPSNYGGSNHGEGHGAHDDDDDDHHGGHDDDDERGGMFDAIAARLKRSPDYDFTALAVYLQRQGGGGYGAMTPEQIAQRWVQVQNCVGSLAQADDDGGGGYGGKGHYGGYGSDDDRSQGGWGYSGSTGQSSGCGGMGTFSGLGEGFQKL